MLSVLPNIWPPVCNGLQYAPGAVAEIVDGKLKISGYGQAPGTTQAFHCRFEESLASPDAVYVVQIRCKLRDIDPFTNFDDQTMAAAGASDFDRVGIFSLRYQDGERVVVLGTDCYCDQPEYVVPWDWGHDTTYTLLVVPGDNAYLEIVNLTTGAMIDRSYYELPTSGNEPDIVAFLSGTVEAEYSYVHYCIGKRDEGTFYGEMVNLEPALPPLPGDRGRMVADSIIFFPDPFDPTEEEGVLHLEVEVLRLPGSRFQLFEYKLETTWDIKTYDPVRTIVDERAVDETGYQAYDLYWDGTDDNGMDAPSGLYIYKVRVELIRLWDWRRFGGSRTIDSVESPWRLARLERPYMAPPNISAPRPRRISPARKLATTWGKLRAR